MNAHCAIFPIMLVRRMSKLTSSKLKIRISKNRFHCIKTFKEPIFRYVHRDQQDAMPKVNLILFSKEIQYWNDKCFPGWINRRLPAAAVEDFNRCRLCDVEVRQTSRHIAETHLMIPLHQCPLCEYGAAESRLVKRHMKNNHKKKDIKVRLSDV